MRTAGLVLLLLAITLALTSFAMPPLDAFLPPAVHREPTPRPQPYVIPQEYERWLRYYADETGTPHWIAARLFSKESTGDVLSGRWDPRAVGAYGELGLAQIMPRNLAEFARLYNDGKPIDPFDPETAIRVGLRHLADLRAETGSWTIGVRCYNGGRGHWANPRKYGPFQPRTIAYARAILGSKE